MNQDNSTVKGASFEARVFRYLEEDINSGDYGISPGTVDLKRLPKYHSKERNSYIQVDIALELYRRGASEPFLIWVWECKNYSKPIPVDDIEEFDAKLQQIGANKTKGTIVSAGSFQKSAVQYAKSRGIGLVRLSPEGGLIHLQEARRNLMVIVESGLSVPDANLLESHFIGLTPSCFYALTIENYIKMEVKPYFRP